jgi:hypothetical protein
MDTLDESKSVVRDTAQLAAAFSPADGRGVFWIVVSDRPTLARFGRDILEQFLGNRYHVALDTAAPNISLRRMAPR